MDNVSLRSAKYESGVEPPQSERFARFSGLIVISGVSILFFLYHNRGLDIARPSRHVGKLVAIHFPEGSVASAREKSGFVRESAKSLRLPAGYIKGSVGAGDAFCAGLLYKLYNGRGLKEMLEFGCAVAAASLSHPTASHGIVPAAQIEALIGRFK